MVLTETYANKVATFDRTVYISVIEVVYETVEKVFRVHDFFCGLHAG